MPRRLPLSAVLAATLVACSGAPPAPATAEVVTIAPAPSAAASAAPEQGAAKGAALVSELDPLDVATLTALGAGSAVGLGGGQGLVGLPSSGGSPGGGGLAPSVPGGLAGSGAAPGTGAPSPAATTHGLVNVRIGPTTGTGNAAVGAATVVAGMAAGFRRCLNKAFASDPASVKNGATLRLTVQLDPNGAVLSVKPSGGVGLSSAASACLVARVSAARFAPPDGGSATLAIPVNAEVTP